MTTIAHYEHHLPTPMFSTVTDHNETITWNYGSLWRLWSWLGDMGHRAEVRGSIVQPDDVQITVIRLTRRVRLDVLVTRGEELSELSLSMPAEVADQIVRALGTTHT